MAKKETDDSRERRMEKPLTNASFIYFVIIRALIENV